MTDPAPVGPDLYPVVGEIGDAAAFDAWIGTVRATVADRLARLGHPSATGHDAMVEAPITAADVLKAADPALYDALADSVVDGSVGVSIGYGFDVYDPVVEAIAAEHIAAIKSWLPSFAQEIADWVNQGLHDGSSIDEMATAALDPGLGPASVADTAVVPPGGTSPFHRPPGGLPSGAPPPPSGAPPRTAPPPSGAPAQAAPPPAPPPIPASPMSAARARTIARTESVAASNGGVYAGWSNAGIEGKTWLATHDARTRIDHIALDGVTIPMDADWLVGGSPARYPGDARLPASQRANCRCTIISNEGGHTRGHIAGTDEEIAARAAKAGLETEGVSRQENQLALLSRLCNIDGSASLTASGWGSRRSRRALFTRQGSPETCPVNTESLSRTTLLVHARSLQIPGRSDMTKAELAGAVAKARAALDDDRSLASRMKGSVAAFSAAQAQTRAKVLNMPKPTDDAVLSGLQNLKINGATGRAGGDSRGSGGLEGGRAKSRAALFKAYGGEENGYVPCVYCNKRLHHLDPKDPRVAAGNPLGYEPLERDKLLTGAQGGKYSQANIVPACGSCNSLRSDAAHPFGNYKWGDPDDNGRRVAKANALLYPAPKKEKPLAITPREGMGDGPRIDPKIIKPRMTAAKHIDADGNWTPERQALHDKIIGKYLDGLPKQKTPELLFMGGGGGAGKSTVLKTGVVKKPKGSVTINADDIKDLFPETIAAKAKGDHRWAASAHEESSYMAKRLQAAAIERHVSITMDAVGSNSDRVIAQLTNARAHGYKVTGAYVTIPPQAGVARAKKRYEDAVAKGEPGRKIPSGTVLEAHRGANDAFQRVAGHLDSATLVDNTDKPIVVARYTAGKRIIVNQSLWDDFKTRGNTVKKTLPRKVAKRAVKASVASPWAHIARRRRRGRWGTHL